MAACTSRLAAGARPGAGPHERSRPRVHSKRTRRTLADGRVDQRWLWIRHLPARAVWFSRQKLSAPSCGYAVGPMVGFGIRPGRAFDVKSAELILQRPV